MAKTEAQRRRARRALELKRLAAPARDERGGDEIKRGGDEIKRGGDEIKRGGDEIKRGDEAFFNDGSSSLSQQIAMDVFGRAAVLGGCLKVTFEAPIGASVRGVGPVRSNSLASVESDAAAIDEVVTDLIRKAKQRRAKAAAQPASRPGAAATQYASATGQPRTPTAKRARSYKSKA